MVNDNAARTVISDDICPAFLMLVVKLARHYSHRSSRSSTFSACLSAEAKTAALHAMAAALKERHELEAQEAQIRSDPTSTNRRQ